MVWKSLIIDRNDLDVFIDNLSIGGVVINVKGNPFKYATVNVCSLPYAFYGGDSEKMTCGSSTAHVLSGNPEVHLAENIVIVLPNGTISTIDKLSEVEFIISNDSGSLAPIEVTINGITTEIEVGASDRISTEVSEIEVDIDIKPGSFPNCLNVNGHGVIPVAILGSNTFDVTQIDISTLKFAGLNVRVKGNSSPQCSAEDVTGDFTNPAGAPDGYEDLICQFVDDPSVWSPDNGFASLTGALYDETAIQGSDTICIVPKAE